MDMAKMGSFLAQLRREHGLTQAQLGERLGVTNKTVSRWETGNYLPPVEMLEALGEMYGLSINELLCGRRLSASEYRPAAEAAIKESLQAGAFDEGEKRRFFQRKWRKEHRWTIALCAAGWCAVPAALALWGAKPYLIAMAGSLLAVLGHAALHNRMMAYVEDKLYGGRWNEYTGRGG